MPANSPLSDKISKDLKKRGCKFVGPIVTYSFIQAIGIVNDHLTKYLSSGKRNWGSIVSAYFRMLAWEARASA